MLSADTAARILLAQLLPAASAVLSYSGNLCTWIEAAAELVAGCRAGRSGVAWKAEAKASASTRRKQRMVVRERRRVVLPERRPFCDLDLVPALRPRGRVSEPD